MLGILKPPPVQGLFFPGFKGNLSPPDVLSPLSFFPRDSRQWDSQTTKRGCGAGGLHCDV